MKAKRRLSDMDFSKEGAHVSLVSKKVGGPASGRTALILKSLENEETMTEEVITKAAHEEFVAKAVADAVEPIQKALDAAKQELETFKAAQVEAEQNIRKQQLADVMGSENPDLEAEFEIVKGLNADVFNLVLKSKVEAKEALAKSALFNEAGASGAGDSNVQAESATARLLKQKYQNS